MPIIPVLGRLREEDHKFQAMLYSKTQSQRKEKEKKG
jgi:hypothetical protein